MFLPWSPHFPIVEDSFLGDVSVGDSHLGEYKTHPSLHFAVSVLRVLELHELILTRHHGSDSHAVDVVRPHAQTPHVVKHLQRTEQSSTVQVFSEHTT